MKRLLGCMGLYAIAAILAPSTVKGELAGYDYRMLLTVNGGKVDAALTNYPVWLKLCPDNFDFSHARSDGYDVRFAAADGETLLDYERERHDSVNETAGYWVRLPLVAGGMDTVFYLYYGKTNAVDGASSSSVWENDFFGVWHLGEGSGTNVADATAAGRDGVSEGEPEWINGAMGGALRFNGADACVNIGCEDVELPSPFTFSFWVSKDDYNTRMAYLSKVTGSTTNGVYMDDSYQASGPYDDGFELASGGGVDSRICGANTPIATGRWVFVTAVCGSDGAVSLYNDAAVIASGSLTPYSAIYGPLYLARRNTQFLKGALDEVRISTAARAPAWIKADYHSGNNMLLSCGGEELLTTYFREVVVRNPGAQTLTNHQVAVTLDTASLIEQEKIFATGANIQFRDMQGVELNYWFDPVTLNTTNTLIWVKIPLLSAYSTNRLFLCYGGDATTSPGDFDVTMSRNPVRDGLVASWPMDQGSGTSLVDATTNGLHGTISGAAWAGIDSVFTTGDSLSFNGSSSYVSVPDSSRLDITGQISLSAWIYPRTVKSESVMRKGPGSSGVYYLYISGSGAVRLAINNIGWDTGGYTLPATGRWYHVVGTYNGQHRRIYVDGELRNEIAQAGVISANNYTLTIGQRGDSAEYFSGDLDELRIYNRALTAGEIAALYAHREYTDAEPTCTVGDEVQGAVIFGRVTELETSNGLAGVSLALAGPGLSSNVTTGVDGYYCQAVPSGWSGTVTPWYACGSFEPTVRTYSNITGNQLDQEYQVQGLSAPGAFDLQGPMEDTSVTNAITFQWTPASCAMEYEVYAGTNTAPPLVGASVSNELTWPLPAEGTYHWYVVARNAKGTSRAPESGTWSFHVPYQNLLCNPGNDEALQSGEIPGWVEVVGTNWSTYATNPLPHGGVAFFYAGAGESAELRQDVDVTKYAAAIDGEGLYFVFQGFVSSHGDGDSARIVVEYRDQANTTVLDAFDSEAQTPNQVWQRVLDGRRAPSGTRIIRVRLISQRVAGTNNNGYFDSLSLHASPDAGIVAISGRVTKAETGTGLDGITLTFSDLATLVTTNGGYYGHSCSRYWNGTVTPSYLCGTFEPASRGYANMEGDQTNQDYQLDVSAPGAFELQAPSNGGWAHNMATLQWTPSDCVETYEVHLGTNAAPPLVATVTDSEFEWVFPERGTCYWYVVARNAAGATRRPESGAWSFSAGMAVPWFEGMGHWRRIAVENAGTETLTDYPVAVGLDTLTLIAEGKLRADGGDLRVVDGIGGEPVSYWIDSSTLNTTNTAIWIKVPALPAGGEAQFVLYYGHSNATTTADGDAVFTFFDDFSSSTLKAGWAFWNPGGNDAYSLTERPGWLRVKIIGDSNTWSAENKAPYMRRAVPSGQNYVIQACADASDVSTNRHMHLAWIRSFSTGADNKGYLGAATRPTTISAARDGTGMGAAQVPNAQHYVRFRRVGSVNYYECSGDGLVWNNMTNFTPSSVATNWGLGGKSWSGGSSYNADYDYFIVRKLAAVEPAAMLGEEQEAGVVEISGRVTDAGTAEGLDGIPLSFSGGPMLTTTNGGYYAAEGIKFWSGTVTPSYVCGTFEPASRGYANLEVDQVHQDYQVQGLSAPGAFALQWPPDGGHVADVANLQWEAASCGQVYEVYVGTNAEPPLVATLAGNQFNWAVPQAGTCYWYVVAHSAKGTERAPASGTWSFTGYQSVVVTGNLTIAADNFSYDNKALLKNGGTLTVQGPHTFVALNLTNGAVLTHSTSTTNQLYGLDLTIAGTLYVSGNSSINVDDKGCPAGCRYPNVANSGPGSYGGLGGSVNDDSHVYGDLRNPNEPGSGGGSGPGGGLVRITAGALALSGTITACGSDGYYSRGSGGGIYLNVGRLSGGGSIRANGGQCTYASAGGGGGRVAVYYQELAGFDISNRISAVGGLGSSPAGGGGTVYIKGEGEDEWLIVGGRTQGGGNTPLSLPAESSNFCGRLMIRGGGTNAVVRNYLTNAIYRSINVETGILVHAYSRGYDLDEVTVGSGSKWEINGTVTARTVTVTGGGCLTHSISTTNEINSLTLVVDDVLTLSGGSSINVDDKGCPNGYRYPNIPNSGAGSYGGLAGGVNDESHVYGDFRHPNEPGSGGGAAPGGGLVRITAETMILGGTITACGSGGYYSRGSGGGIYLNVGQLSGGGLIRANGGQCTYSSAGGSGGRVAVYYRELAGFNITNRISAAGGLGSSSTSAGGGGTIYVKGEGDPEWLVVGGATGGAWITPLSLPEGASNFQGRITMRGSSTNALVRCYLTNTLYTSIRVETGTFYQAASTGYDLGELTVGSGGCLEISGTVTARSVTLTGNGVLTHSACTSNVTHHLTLVVDGELSIASTAAIDVSGKGYPRGYTYPGTAGASTANAGGSYGGLGGALSGGTPSPVYGDWRNPNEPGSGSSGTGSDYGNQAGGGLVRIMAETMVLDGAVRANGVDLGYGRGSGGGIYVEVGELSGSGQMQARGGNSIYSNYGGGGGGGGRVAIYYQTLSGFDLANRVSAAGGTGSSAPYSGGAGTIYVKGLGEEEWLCLDAGSATYGTTPISLPEGATSFDGRLTIRGNTTNQVVNNQLVNARYTALEVLSGRLVQQYTGEYALDILSIGTGGRLEFPLTQELTVPSVMLAKGAELEFNGTLHAQAMTLASNAVVTHSACTTNQTHGLNLVVDETLTVGSNASIDVSGKGYPRGYTHPGTASGASTVDAGGSYGGLGGALNGGTPNPVYGDWRNPNELGSGSGAGHTSGNQAGGGLVRITAGTLALDGTISANGVDGSYGRGSGGGIYAEVGALSGGGQMQAKGGNSLYYSGGGGGGGRVAIYYQTLSGFDLSNRVSASGGTSQSSNSYGETGTVYCVHGGPPLRVLSFSPAGYVKAAVGSLTLTFGSEVNDATFSLEDVSLTGPSGAVGLSALTKLDVFRYQIDLASPAQADGAYEFTLGTNLLSQGGTSPLNLYTNGFLLDLTAPQAPVVTNYAAPPATNGLKTTSVTLKGTREADTAIWINGTQRASYGTGSWSVNLTLGQGVNHLAYWAKDRAGNVSATNRVAFLVDTVAPVASGFFPAGYTNVSPPFVRMTYVEATSGLDWPVCSNSITKSGVTIPGTWEMTSTNTIVFTPAGSLLDGYYYILLRLVDRMGNFGGYYAGSFTVDTAAPAPPVVNEVTTPTTINQQTITGTRETNTTILRNGAQVVASGSSTNWSYTQSLTNGWNYFAYTAKDAAQNMSGPTNVAILYDNTAPGPVAVTAQVYGSGTAIALGWSGYNELTNGGDIASYTIYHSESSFNQVSEATAIGTRSAGQKSFGVTGLVRGVTRYYAVMARDTSGQAISNVTSIAAAPVDVLPPPNPTGLAFDCGWSNLTVRWSPSSNPDADLVGYKVYFNNEPTGLDVGLATQQLFEGLSPATGYPVRITSVDADDNESAGATGLGVTWLVNPTNVWTEPYDGRVTLTWSASRPTNYVRRYEVYAGTNDFADIGGRAPSAVVTNLLTATVAGLANDREYFFAVVAVNLSEGRDTNVTTVSALPLTDTQGPTISQLAFDGVAVTSGSVLVKAGTLSLRATDPAGVSRAEFWLNGTLRQMATMGPTNFTFYWVVSEEEDGPYELAVRAYDTLGNDSAVTQAVRVALAAPTQAPAITNPANGRLVSKNEIAVSGTAPKHTDVVIYRNGEALPATLVVDGNGRFGGTVSLIEQTNQLRAAARNRAGTGPTSSVVTVTLDSSKPAAPGPVLAENRAGGVIRLSWSAPAGASPKGYRMYRATSSFTSTGEAVRLNATLFTGTSYNDTPPTDGAYVYRVSTVNAADTEGDLSVEAWGLSDRTAPRATSLVLTPRGAYDPVSGRMGAGVVDVALGVSEKLLATPFLSMTPNGGYPVSVVLQRRSDTNYTGYFEILPTTPSGVGAFVFSARDLVDNRGAVIEGPSSVMLDTAGPRVTGFVVQPAAPMENSATNPVTVSVTLVVDEAPPTGYPPELRWILSGHTNAAEVVTNLVMITSQSWSGSFALPSWAGNPVEDLSFTFAARDDLGNVGSVIEPPHAFQVYQGDLPSLGTPFGLTAASRPGGKIALVWNRIDEASDYQLYRAPAGQTLSALARSSGALSYTDAPPTEGIYTYAVASVRQANGRESVSAPSEPVSALADATAPGVPTDLALALVGNGLRVDWAAPAYTEPVTYSIYRSTGDVITTVQGLSPIGAGVGQLFVVDPHPSKLMHVYTVTAVDAAGNESEPAASAYLNFTLLPPNGMAVRQEQGGLPTVSWSHPYPGDVAGYYLSVGPSGATVRLNESLLVATSHVDVGYANDERRYEVIAVDAYSHESPPRLLTLPRLEAGWSDIGTVKRRVMNRMRVTVANRGVEAASNVLVRLTVGAQSNISERVTIAVGETLSIPVVISGRTNLPDRASARIQLEQSPASGNLVVVGTTGSVSVADDTLSADVLCGAFVRGGRGPVQWWMRNTSEEEIEVVTATSNGTKDSPYLRFRLLDEQGNVYAVAPVRQISGRGVVSLANGDAVARIPAGGEFLSAVTEALVPTNLPAVMYARLEIDRVYYHRARADEQWVEGLSARRQVSVEDTPYFALVTNVAPRMALGAQPIRIEGVARYRVDGNVAADKPVNLSVSVRGMIRQYEVWTDAEGHFAYWFEPTAGESGLYLVWANHPDFVDQMVQDEFVISRVGVTPTTITLTAPYGTTQNLSVKATTGEGTELTNLRLEVAPEDQPGGALATGLTVQVGSGIAALGSGQSGTLPFSLLSATSLTGGVYLRVVSDETVTGRWATVRVNYTFKQPQPQLAFTPTYVSVGMARSNVVQETISLSNPGLDVLRGVNLRLVDGVGTPAPDWVAIEGPTDLGDIAVGDTRSVRLVFRPTGATPVGNHTYYMAVTSSNLAERKAGLYVTVTESGVGGALFKIVDLFTGTLDAQSNVIQGVAGATVELQSEEVTSLQTQRVSDAYGEAGFTDLPSGSYRVRINAPQHNSYIGRIWVQPGVTLNEEVALEYSVVSVEWSVQEITIQDQYEIVLTAVYQTDVPAPVVVPEPKAVGLPMMEEGDVFNGELRLSNRGLIRADNLRIAFPTNDAFAKYDHLATLPESLEPQAIAIIPYRVTCLKAFTNLMPCKAYAASGKLSYEFQTASQRTFSRNDSWYYLSPSTPCFLPELVGTENGDGQDISTLDRDFQEQQPPPQSVLLEQGEACWGCPDILGAGSCSGEGGSDDIWTRGPGDVQLLIRAYLHRAVDLRLGALSVERRYDGRQWRWGYVVGQYPMLAALFTRQDGRPWNVAVYHGGRPVSDGLGGTNSPFILSGPETNAVLAGVRSASGTQVLWVEYDTAGRIKAVQDEAGRRVEYAYQAGRLAQVVSPDGQLSQYEYDQKGNLTRFKNNEEGGHWIGYDRNRNVTSLGVSTNGEPTRFIFNYDGRRREYQAQINRASGGSRAFRYRRDGSVKRVEADGLVLRLMTQDRLNQTVTDAYGNMARYTYGADHLLRTAEPPGGGAWNFEFDALYKQLTRVSDPSDLRWLYDYNGAGLLTNAVAGADTAAERRYAFSYDGAGRLTRSERLGTAPAYVEIVYGTNGLPSEIRDAAGTNRFLMYDTAGRVLLRQDRAGRQWRYLYDAANRVESILDSSGRAYSFGYDSGGNMTLMTDPLGAVTSMEYDQAGRLVARTDAVGNRYEVTRTDDGWFSAAAVTGRSARVRIRYDGHGRPIEFEDDEAHKTEVSYDALNPLLRHPVRVTLPSGAVEDYSYDALRRLTGVTRGEGAGAGTVAGFSYDSLGRIATARTADGLERGFAYDVFGAVTSVTVNAGSGGLQIERDAAGRPVRIADAGGTVRHLSWDAADRLTNEVNAANRAWRSEYDGEGRPVRMVDPTTNTILRSYDGLGRLTQTVYAAQGALPAVTNVFGYEQSEESP